MVITCSIYVHCEGMRGGGGGGGGAVFDGLGGGGLTILLLHGVVPLARDPKHLKPQTVSIREMQRDTEAAAA